MHHIVHTTAFATPVVGHWLERENTSRNPPCGIDPTTLNKMSGRSTTEPLIGTNGSFKRLWNYGLTTKELN